LFEVAAGDSDRKIGDGAHRRRIVNALEFEKRFGEDGQDANQLREPVAPISTKPLEVGV
jgi:hypothetical protein